MTGGRASGRPNRTLRPRDQGISAFSVILLRLCDASGALGVALVDSEGETVDYAGRIEPYDLRVAAAEWRLVLGILQSTADKRARSWADVNEVIVRAQRQSFAFTALSDGYALVLVLPRYSFHVSRRALAQATDELASEAGLLRLGPDERLRWSRTEVRPCSTDERRPEAIWHDGAWRPVTVLGRLPPQNLETLEIGYLARVSSGRELLLVREPLGKWFAGDPT